MIPLWVFIVTILSVIAIAVLWVRFLSKILIKQTEMQFKLKLEQWKDEELSKIKNASVKASRSTIKGQLAEQFFPFSDKCPYLASDLMFIGKLFDYLGTIGYTASKDDGGHIEEVVFIEIKTASSKLSRHQAQFKKIIEQRKVRWETIHID